MMPQFFIEFKSSTEEINEKPETIPRPIATPLLDESTPLPAPAIDSERSGFENSIFPKESLLDKLKVSIAEVIPNRRKKTESTSLNLFIRTP